MSVLNDLGIFFISSMGCVCLSTVLLRDAHVVSAVFKVAGIIVHSHLLRHEVQAEDISENILA